MEDYDAILMVTEKNIPLLKLSVPYLQRNLGAKRIFLVGSRKLESATRLIWHGEVKFIDENSILEGLCIEKIIKIFHEKGISHDRAGWFLQQFLKMAYSGICRDNYYLVWDADTVPLHKIDYFEDELPVFITKKEYNEEYFRTIDKLFCGKVKRLDENVSYIAENMLISKKLMQSMIDDIQHNILIPGTFFYEKILNAIEPDVLYYTGFSEFETYGNYVDTVYSGLYRKKKLRTQRLGSFLVGTHPTAEQLAWVGKDYDIISFEEHGKQWLKKITKIQFVRNKCSAKKMFDFWIQISNTFDRILGRQVYIID